MLPLQYRLVSLVVLEPMNLGEDHRYLRIHPYGENKAKVKGEKSAANDTHALGFLCHVLNAAETNSAIDVYCLPPQ